MEQLNLLKWLNSQEAQDFVMRHASSLLLLTFVMLGAVACALPRVMRDPKVGPLKVVILIVGLVIAIVAGLYAVQVCKENMWL